MKTKSAPTAAITLIFFAFSFSGSEAQILPRPSVLPAAIPTPTVKNKEKNTAIRSSIFKRKPHQSNPPLDNPEISRFFIDQTAYYDRLNTSLDPLLVDKPAAAAKEDKFWSVLAASTSGALAAVAAGQATGILPGKPKTK